MINPKFIKEISQPHWIILYLYFFLVLVNSIFCYFNKESFSNLNTFGDSVYFSIVTITTLGYGDLCPINGLGKFMVSIASVAGVILLGFFLISVSSEIAYKKERQRIETMKLSFKEQYKIWRENTIRNLVSLTENKNVEYEEFYDVSKFQDYFTKNSNRYWYEVMNNLSDNSYSSIFYQKELIHEIEFLQRNIETFIMQVPIEDIEVLNVLNRYINGLYKLRKQDLNDNDEFRLFMGRLKALINSYDSSIGEYEKNYLLDAIEAI